MANSPFIITLFCSFRDTRFVYMLFEAATGGSLEDLINVRHHANPEAFAFPKWSEAVMFYVAGIAEGLQHLHTRKIAHRDLKPGNVLLDSRGNPKLCDLGFARFVLSRTYTFLGTPEYMSPELLDFPHEHDHRVDWWALGVLAFELFAGQTPWCPAGGAVDAGAVAYLILRSQKAKPFPEDLLPAETPTEARSLMMKLLNAKEARRLVGSELPSEKWFEEAKFDFEALRNGGVKPVYSIEEIYPSEGDVEDQEVSFKFLANSLETMAEGVGKSISEVFSPTANGQADQKAEDCEPDEHDEDDVFPPIKEEEYMWTNVHLAGGVISKVDGKNKSYDAFATLQSPTAVRVTCEEAVAKGVIRFGLTVDVDDDHNFAKGYWVGILPSLPSGRSKADGNSYLVALDCLPITLCIEEGEVVVLKNGKMAHKFGVASEKGHFAKVYLTDNDDAARISAFAECDDDAEDANWDAAFQLPTTPNPNSRGGMTRNPLSFGMTPMSRTPRS
eukprot:TRINITY_DN12665_c0_g4_i1.p1 TRINITY_DN12665_c0_g4~~TRINITY_DN12665_c0_g4_i1.p1  ORF type:complete len:553 (-),score=120.96 TRINITY_DN12665_c0_g4_i1:275-1777(-)